jgi:hypothetical protein
MERDDYSRVESVEYRLDDECDWYDPEEDGDRRYVTRTYGCDCCSNRNEVTAPEAREAAESLLRRIEAEAERVRKFIRDLDAREAQ